MRRLPWKAFALALLLASGILFPSTVCRAGQEGDLDARLAGAVDALRGKDLKGLSRAEQEAHWKTLDAAWDLILDHQEAAKPLVRAALASEQEDSVRIIDLAHLLTRLDLDMAEEGAAGLMRADPNAYPKGYYDVASIMGAVHCGKCLPAVQRILEVDAIESYISVHALPIGQDLGLTFTLGHYGDKALPAVLEGLGSPDCVVRSNAALAASILLPVTEPPILRRIAAEDPCERARGSAWYALGVFDSPVVGRLAVKRLETSPGPSAPERKEMVAGLGVAFSDAVVPPLKRLAADRDPEIKQRAHEALKARGKDLAPLARLRTRAGSASPAQRAKVLKFLETARSDGRFEYEGEPKDVIAALTATDLPLVSAARAAVLNRLSDECLYEYETLTMVVRVLRDIGAGAAPGSPGDDAGSGRP